MSTNALPELLLVRHGETEWSRTGRHTGRTDLDLLDSGHRQVAELAPLLQRVLAGRALAAAWSSPLARARTTAGILLPDSTPAVTDLVRELDYGEYEGLTSQQILAQRPDWNLWRDGFPGGESPEDASRRAEEFLRLVRGAAGPVAVFSHGHFLRILATTALGLPPRDGGLVMLSTASLSVLGSEHGRPAIALWNATAGVG